MKKNYFMLAAATMMFAACAETDLVNEVNVEEAQKAIGFETFANKTTRTGIDSRTALNSYHTTFGVWTYKSTSTNPVMDNYKVSYTVTQTTDASGNTVSTPSWEYAGEQGRETQTLKYWDKNAEYSFYAYAPYSTTVTIDANKNIIIPWGEYAANENLQESLNATPNTNDFTGVGSSNNAKSTDWLIAIPITNNTSYTQKVNETFAHTMSRLIVKVSSTVANTVINSISVNDVYGMGMYDGSEWNTSYTDESGEEITAPLKSIEGKTGQLDAADTDYYTMEYLLIPTEKEPSFSINYAVNGDIYNVKNVKITNIESFVANTSYTLSVSIDLSAIEFTATAADFATTAGNGSVTIE